MQRQRRAMRAALVIEHEDDAPAGLLADWATARGAAALVPAGPWLQWHRDAFTLPPHAQLLARSAIGPQAFRRGRHLGVQFHPEVTPAIVTGWGSAESASLHRAGITPEAIAADSTRLAEQARRQAFALFDAFLSPPHG